MKALNKKVAMATGATLLLVATGTAAMAALGTSTPTDTTYLLDDSYRVYDSRNDAAQSPFSGGDTVIVDATSDENQDQKIPSDAKGVIGNVTVIPTNDAMGFASVSSGDISVAPSTGTLAWHGDSVFVSNAFTTKISADDHPDYPHSLAVTLGGGASARAEIVIDIIGYYK